MLIPARNIRVSGLGVVPAILAEEVKVGDRLLLHVDHICEVIAVQKVSAHYIRIVMKSPLHDHIYRRRVKKTRRVARKED